MTPEETKRELIAAAKVLAILFAFAAAIVSLGYGAYSLYAAGYRAGVEDFARRTPERILERAAQSLERDAQ